MGIIVCKAHGRGGVMEICSHVATQIEDGGAPTGHRLKIIGCVFMCAECFHELGFKRFASLAELPAEEQVEVTDGRMEAFKAAYNAIRGRRVFCSQCFAEAEGRSQLSAL